jgi:hypothetical protein
VGLWWFEGELPPCLLYIGGTGNILHFFVTRRDLGGNLEYKAKSKAEDIGVVNSGVRWAMLTLAFIRTSIRQRRPKTASQICSGGGKRRNLVQGGRVIGVTCHVASFTFINAVAFLCSCNLSSFKSHRMLRPISSWPRPGRSEKYSRSAHDDKTVSLLCPQQLFNHYLN